MSRNQFGGTCYRCGKWSAPGAGHFEKIPRRKRLDGRAPEQGKWRLQHAGCAIDHRGTNQHHLPDEKASP